MVTPFSSSILFLTLWSALMQAPANSRVAWAQHTCHVGAQIASTIHKYQQLSDQPRGNISDQNIYKQRSKNFTFASRSSCFSLFSWSRINRDLKTKGGRYNLHDDDWDEDNDGEGDGVHVDWDENNDGEEDGIHVEPERADVSLCIARLLLHLLKLHSLRDAKVKVNINLSKRWKCSSLTVLGKAKKWSLRSLRIEF